MAEQVGSSSGKGRERLKGFKPLRRAFPFFWESSSLHGNHSFYTLSMVMSPPQSCVRNMDLFSQGKRRARAKGACSFVPRVFSGNKEEGETGGYSEKRGFLLINSFGHTMLSSSPTQRGKL